MEVGEIKMNKINFLVLNRLKRLNNIVRIVKLLDFRLDLLMF